MPSASSNGSAPRYAPEDPTLPEPWKGLVDGSTGYLYYWNPVTNVTQYEKPIREKLPGPPPLPPPPAKPASMSVSSSVHRRESHDDDERSRSHKYQGGRPSGSHSLQDSGDIGHSHGHSSRTSTRAHGSLDAGGGLSLEAYRRQHEITINEQYHIIMKCTGFELQANSKLQQGAWILDGNKKSNLKFDSMGTLLS